MSGLWLLIYKYTSGSENMKRETRQRAAWLDAHRKVLSARDIQSFLEALIELSNTPRNAIKVDGVWKKHIKSTIAEFHVTLDGPQCDLITPTKEVLSVLKAIHETIEARKFPMCRTVTPVQGVVIRNLDESMLHLMVCDYC